MKNCLLTILLFVCVSFFAQTSSTSPPGSAATSPSSACLACPGPIWNNEMNVTVLDGNPSDVSLSQYGFCFQSSCFASRYLSTTQYNFTIPGTASIVGIEVSITRKATDTSAIKDSIVQLSQNSSPAGILKKVSTYWDTSYTTVTYGGPSDLWGFSPGTWTPANINSSIGLNLKVFNTLATPSQSVFVDFISMTVYYTNSTGIIQSQTGSPKMLRGWMDDSGLNVSFFTQHEDMNNELSLFGADGSLIVKKETGKLSKGEHSLVIDTRFLCPGMLVLQHCNGTTTVLEKILLVK